MLINEIIYLILIFLIIPITKKKKKPLFPFRTLKQESSNIILENALYAILAHLVALLGLFSIRALSKELLPTLRFKLDLHHADLHLQNIYK